MKRLGSLDVAYVKGVGESRAKILKTYFEIGTARDLLSYFPFRYVDRSRFFKISELMEEMPNVQLLGHFVSFETEGEGAKRRLRALFSDGRSLMEVIWFSKINYFKSAYKPGQKYVIFGKPTQFRGSWSISHPEVEVYDPDKPPTGLRGVYTIPDKAKGKGFSTLTLQNIFSKAFESPQFQDIRETLPPEIVARYNLMPLAEALRAMHLPKDSQSVSKARERMKFEELFYLQLQILQFVRNRDREVRGIEFTRIGEYFNQFYSRALPFELTGAQKRVLKEIRADMKTGRQMNRLLQGDVGSGKTMVAFMTMLMAADNGYQSCIMAPTEILANQHFETISKWAQQVGLRVALLTGSTRAKQRREIHEGLENGTIHLAVGTHALLEENVKFKSLGLAVIDEQHRFGVAQRARMWSKNTTPPHVLVMTATPIPRTLAMTVYGDLEVSVIDELPPGRKPVTTLLRYDENRESVNRLINRQIAEGRQVYIVYPLIDDNPKLELKSLESGLEFTQRTFPNVEVAWVHGRMKAAEKDARMARFISGEAKILVATMVIEVGVNVPNATVMMIQNAERFGLSQLHQLRGRVGRGADQSFCILMTKQNIAQATRQRLNIMTETTDGFLISEADLKMRGPGDMEGTQQSGVAFSLKVADLARDGQILAKAREAAKGVLNGNPELVKNSGNASSAIAERDNLRLSADSVALLGAEMQFRFARTTDWSRIS